MYLSIKTTKRIIEIVTQLKSLKNQAIQSKSIDKVNHSSQYPFEVRNFQETTLILANFLENFFKEWLTGRRAIEFTLRSEHLSTVYKLPLDLRKFGIFHLSFI